MLVRVNGRVEKMWVRRREYEYFMPNFKGVWDRKKIKENFWGWAIFSHIFYFPHRFTLKQNGIT